MLTPGHTAFVFSGIIIVVIVLFIGVVLLPTASPNEKLVDKPYKLSSAEERAFRKAYGKAIKQLSKSTTVSGSSSGGGDFDLLAMQAQATGQRLQRPQRMSYGGSGKYCCAPLLYKEDGSVEVLARSSTFSCQPCEKIRPWCPGPTSKAECDSGYCRWRDGQCLAIDRPMAVNSVFCDPNGSTACFDYDRFPLVTGRGSAYYIQPERNKNKTKNKTKTKTKNKNKNKNQKKNKNAD